jgi:hypothetical protein
MEAVEGMLTRRSFGRMCAGAGGVLNEFRLWIEEGSART